MNASISRTFGVLVGLSGLVSGCGPHHAASSNKVQAAKVAPTFVHGTGAAYPRSCNSMALLLSERDALQIVTEELSKAGVELSVKDRRLAGFTIDAVDERRHIAVEFVSCEDYAQKGGTPPESVLGAEDYQAVARHVAASVAAHGTEYNLGVFYDPAIALSPYDPVFKKSTDDFNRKLARTEGWDNIRAVTREYDAATADAAKPFIEASRSLLREQVRDFIAWLKSEGAI